MTPCLCSSSELWTERPGPAFDQKQATSWASGEHHHHRSLDCSPGVWLLCVAPRSAPFGPAAPTGSGSPPGRSDASSGARPRLPL
eukprot:2692240-Prorocentrum_lima.AAC.1